MSAFLHDVARASLPVAIVLLILAATARAALWAELDHAPARRVAREHLEPLSSWCLIALAVHTLALTGAGELGLFSLALPVALGVAAVLLLRTEGEASEPEEQPAVPAPRAAPEPAPAPTGSLWAGDLRR